MDGDRTAVMMGVARAVADTVDLAAVWTAATDELADEIVSAQQRAYLRLTRLRAIVEDTALLSVPDAFTRDVIESRLRPAITDLDVNAPDLDTSTNVRTFTTEAGEMTLYMELYDSATGDKIGEVADREQAIDRSHFQYTNRVTNRAEANRILNKWAKLLVDALDEARSKG